MKTFIKTSLLALFATVAIAVNAADQPLIGDTWTLSLGGSGTTTTTGDSQSIFGATFDVGHTGFLLVPLQAGLRQSFGYNSQDSGTTLFDSHLYLDATVLKYKKLDLFLGGEIGLTYGNTPLLWSGGPEAGVRFWLKQDVAFVGRVSYPFDINNNRSEDTLKYFLGIQINL